MDLKNIYIFTININYNIDNYNNNNNMNNVNIHQLIYVMLIYTYINNKGHLLSVAPKFVNLVHNLFTVNERIALIGRWKHGFFSMVPVGATNVGSVVLTIDDVSFTTIINYFYIFYNNIIHNN